MPQARREEQANLLIAVFCFVFGLVIGSFLNVCIRRLPQGRSIVRPGSHCPACNAPIRAWDNIPLLSYVVLRGRCRSCGARISLLYPTVELAAGLMFLIGYFSYGLSWLLVKNLLLFSLLLVLIFTDLLERTLPDAITLGGAAAGIGVSLLVPPGDGTARWLSGKLFAFPPPALVINLADALLGAGISAGALWLVGAVYARLRGRHGLGFGDVKMMLLLGTFLGLKLTLLAVLVGSLLGSIGGILFIWVARKDFQTYELPFGTFLGLAGMLVAFYGRVVLAWYESFLRAGGMG